MTEEKNHFIEPVHEDPVQDMQIYNLYKDTIHFADLEDLPPDYLKKI